MGTRCLSCHADIDSHGHYIVKLDRITFDDEKVLKKGLEQNYGICDVRFNYFSGDVFIDYNPKHIKPEEIEKALASPGYVLESNGRRWLGKTIERHGATSRAAISAVLVAASWVLFLALGDEKRLSSAAFIIVNMLAIISSGYPTLRGLLYALREKKSNAHILVAAAALGAIALSNWLAASTILFVSVISEAIESVCLRRAHGEIIAGFVMSARYALVKDDDTEAEIPIHKVFRGQRLVVRQGMGIPVDGVVLSGGGQISDSALTGESALRGVNAADRVLAGMVLESGSLEMEATSVGENTVIAGIARLVEKARRQKTVSENAIDRFAQYLIPGAFFIAFTVFLADLSLFHGGIVNALERGITVLIVACPYAAVLAAPMAIAAAIGRSAESGVLFRDGGAIERLDKATTLLIDKTGTLTYARPHVEKVRTFGNISIESMLSDAATVEQGSNHPIARAICDYARQRNVFPGKPDRFMEFEGGGACAKSGNRLVKVGARWLMEDGRQFPEEVTSWMKEAENSGYSSVLVADDQKIMGGFLIADQVREDARTTLSRLKSYGIKRIVMVTGDRGPIAQRVAAALGLDEYFAEYMPDAKLKKVEEFKAGGDTVAMAGDGINDAPALAAADVGIAMGAMGSDSAMGAADIAVMTKDLRGLVDAFMLSKLAVNVIRHNIFFAAAVGSILAILAALGRISLLTGATLYLASALAIILNSYSIFPRKKG